MVTDCLVICWVLVLARALVFWVLAPLGDNDDDGDDDTRSVIVMSALCPSNTWRRSQACLPDPVPGALLGGLQG